MKLLNLKYQKSPFMAKTIQINFKNLQTVPIDVRKILQKEQQKEKEKKGIGKYSIALVLCKIIRAWNNKCNESQ